MLKIDKKEGDKSSKGRQHSNIKKEHDPAHKIEGDIIPVSHPTMRKGNYSAIGYNSLDIPPTEAELWNKPFVDPEFGYESHSDDFH